MSAAPQTHPGAAPALTHLPALRFLTAGSVDDGKSTLIGRLLFDSRAILADQMDNLEARAAKTAGGAPRAVGAEGGPAFDLSLLTDGLEAEREQGITIDVAYRYFATPARKFIIADAPGHEQYTRNMVTAAAGSDAAVVLVDITKLDTTQAEVTLLPQTRRHSLLARLLRVPSVVFAVNKLDAVAEPGPADEPLEPWSSLRASTSRPSCLCRRCAATTSAAPCGRPGTAGLRCCRCWKACRRRQNARPAP